MLRNGFSAQVAPIKVVSYVSLRFLRIWKKVSFHALTILSLFTKIIIEEMLKEMTNDRLGCTGCIE